jgi:hypothetical protein
MNNMDSRRERTGTDGPEPGREPVSPGGLSIAPSGETGDQWSPKQENRPVDEDRDDSYGA